MESTTEEFEKFRKFDDMMNGNLDAIKLLYSIYIAYFNRNPDKADEKIIGFATKTQKFIYDKKYKRTSEFINPDYRKGFLGVLDLIIKAGSGKERHQQSSRQEQA